MKYALVNGEVQEAQPGLSGECKSCGSPTIAKCGEIKIWHWAHRGKRMCDPWWENETEWHRNWKNCFPVDWQEFIQQDQNGERHIADVKTAQGWVLEFQHSFLNPEERRARNAFYEKLVWVVDGTRRKLDKKQFLKLLDESNPECINPHVRKFDLNDCALLREWSGIHGPVFFDFGEEVIWCLVPIGQDKWGYVMAFPRREFIEFHSNDGDQAKQNFEGYLKILYDLVNLLIESAALALHAQQQRHLMPRMRRARRL